MKKNDLLKMFPNASQEFIQQNTATEDTGSDAAMECNPRNESLAKTQVQKTTTGRVLIRVTSSRKRLADEDGLCEKYFVDCLRYAGLISGDSPEQAKIETSQRKVEKGEEESTLIEIFQIE